MSHSLLYINSRHHWHNIIALNQLPLSLPLVPSTQQVSWSSSSTTLLQHIFGVETLNQAIEVNGISCWGRSWAYDSDQDSKMACRWPLWPPVQRMLNPKEITWHNEADVPDAQHTTQGGTGWVWGVQMVKRLHQTWTYITGVDSTSGNSCVSQELPQVCLIPKIGMWTYNGPCTMYKTSTFFSWYSLPPYPPLAPPPWCWIISTTSSTILCYGSIGMCSCTWNLKPSLTFTL